MGRKTQRRNKWICIINRQNSSVPTLIFPLERNASFRVTGAFYTKRRLARGMNVIFTLITLGKKYIM